MGHTLDLSSLDKAGGITAGDEAQPVGPAPAATADVAVVGAGLGGSILALVLARQGLSVAVVDPYAAYRADFRCEKLMGPQVGLLEELGVADGLEAAAGAGPSGLGEVGFRYDHLVNAMRGLWPEGVQFIQDRAKAITTGPGLQRIVLAGGGSVKARLAVLATGPSGSLRKSLGIEREVLSERHSVCVGFTLAPRAGLNSHFQGLVRHGERAGDGVAFVSLFPCAGAIRVNLFLYLDPRSDVVHGLRGDPLGGLVALMPGLKPVLDGMELVEPAEVRATDLYRTTGHEQPGVVLIGDAFASSCPATGVGVTRLLTDIRELAAVHLPEWLETDGMGVEKIARYYADPERTRLDALAVRQAMTARSMATETSPAWRLRRGLAPLKRWARSAAHPHLPVRPVATAPLARGDQVRVRSAAEILATLDADGALDGLPFMPEMLAFCGATLTVHRRAEMTCVEGQGLRSMQGAVLLQAARCDGSAHDGCQRACLMFWKEAWLRPVALTDAPRDAGQEAAAIARLQALPTFADGRYRCQSTTLGTATAPLSRWDFGHLFGDVRRGELSTAGLISILARVVVNRARRLVGLPELEVLKGVATKPPRGDLGLKPGEWVRVKPVEALRQFVTPDSRNFGMTFEPEMTGYAGQLHQVDFPVERIIHEETGKMIALGQTVTLKGVTCEGRCTRNCPRANPLYWRESWLERAGGEPAESQ